MTYGGPEYETIGLLGSNLGVDNITAVAAWQRTVQRAGAGHDLDRLTLSWAVECFERGLLTEADTGGTELRWNDPETYLRLIEMIARREGFGDLLAEGSLRAA